MLKSLRVIKMKCPINHLFSLFITALSLFLPFYPTYAGERDDLYQNGLKAYESKDYVVALKDLYAFYVLNKTKIDADPDFMKKILGRISTSESNLKSSFEANTSFIEPSGRKRLLRKFGGDSFGGKGKEIQDSLNKKIDLESIKDRNLKPQ